MADYENDPVLQKYKFPVQKAVDSDKKRLAAILDKIEQEKAAKQLIKSALSGQISNKKIIFNDPIPTKKFKNESSKSKLEPFEPSLKSKQLFDDNDDGLDGNESINLDIPSKRWKNSKESKLIDLQSRFAHDPRFKIDDKFVEDDDDEKDPLEGTSKTETDKDLDILEELLGKPLKRKVEHSSDKQLPRSIIIPRYDPSKPESQKFKIRKVDKLEPYQLPDEKDDDDDQGDKPEISKERFYEISETFKKDFTDDPTDGQSFSLTAMFGRPVADIPETSSKLGTVKSKSKRSAVDESSDDETQRSKKKIPQTKSIKRSKSKQESDSEVESEDDAEDDEEEDEEDDDKDEDEDSKSKKKTKKVEESTKKRKIIAGDVELVPKKFNDSESIEFKKGNQLKGKSKVSNPLLKYERFCFTENDGRLTSDTFYNIDRIKSHINTWKEKKIVMTTALTKKRRHFKHVTKLATALENGNTRDKDLRLKYRIYKETTKKH